MAAPKKTQTEQKKHFDDEDGSEVRRVMVIEKGKRKMRWLRPDGRRARKVVKR